MRIDASVAAVLALAGSLAWSGVSAREQQATTSGTAVVAGQVIDATSKQPVAGAVVTISVSAPAAAASPAAPPNLSTLSTSSAPPRRAAAITNGEGRFVFRDLPAGTYALAAMRNGYIAGAIGRRRPNGPSSTLSVADGVHTTNAVILIWRMPTISGVLRDDRGEPAVGVYVTAMRRTTNGGRMELNFSGGEATDDRGHYRILLLEPGSYVVIARMNLQTSPVSMVERYRAAAASGTATQLARELREGGAMQPATEGLVIDGWQVSNRGDGALLPGPNGTLFLSPLTFYGSVGSPAAATVLTLGPGEDREGIDFTRPLVAGVRVSGTLTGLDRPAANHGVQLVPVATGNVAYPFSVASSTTDASGRFAFLGVAPGAYTVRALRVPSAGPLFTPSPPAAGAAPGREVVTVPPPDSFPAMFAEAAVTVGSAPVDGVALVFQTGAKFSGRVVFDGQAAPPPAAQLQRLQVTVRPAFGGDSRGTSGQSMVDASGTFQTTGYAPGRYFITVNVPGPGWEIASIRAGGADAFEQAVTLGTTDVTDVVITYSDKTMTLSGNVRVADSSADAEATVVAFPADQKAWLASGMSPRRVVTATASDSGVYQLRIGIPGDYLVVAIPPEIAPDVDPEFIARFAASATRVSIASGESKTQPLTVSRVR